MEQTSARLRKTFRYSVDGEGDDDLPEALDEEEQESLIRTLDHQNTTRNNQYRLALLSLSLLSTIPYLTTLPTPHLRLLSLLSITSLLSTSYLLYSLPAGRTSISFLDPPTHQAKSRSQRLQDPDEGPVLSYLPYLNIALCTVLVLLGWVVERKLREEAGLWRGFGWLPMGVYAVVLLAKWVMGSVDPEGELGGLRYGFKGA